MEFTITKEKNKVFFNFSYYGALPIQYIVYF